MNNLQTINQTSDLRKTAWNSLSENTKQAYQNDLMLFAKHYDINKANPDNILNYINNLKGKGFKNATINRRISSLSKFYKVQVAAGIRQNNPVEDLKSVANLNFRIQRDVEVPLTEEEFKLLPNNKTSLIIKFLANTGLRISELINIKNKDVTIFNDQYYKIRILGKGSKERTIYISQDMYNKIKEQYPEDLEYLFYTKNKSSYDRRVLWKQINEMFMKYTGKDIHPHQMRHFYGTTQISVLGRDVKAVSKSMGHSSSKICLDFYVDTNLKPEEFNIGII